MTQALPKPITFEDFLEWKPEAGRYELHDWTIIEMQPTGEYEEIKGFLTTKLIVEFNRVNLPYFIPDQALVKPLEKESGYLPDVLILNRANLAAEPLWKKYSTVTQGASIPLTAEQVFRVGALPEQQEQQNER
ncbi:MAG TPA: Uma2 family endonuclease [Waterburya sp.]